MDTNDPLLPQHKRVSMVTTESEPVAPTRGTLATRDHQVIQQWAARRQAEPATGEATASGPATVDINDGAAGIRFNFPGFGRFRPITWKEWFDNFDRHQLTFVYEARPENENSPSAAFRLVKTEKSPGEVG